MTNHWRHIKNSDLILINGANPAEAHPVGFQWFMRAKLDRGAKMIHADPRFTRTSAVSDMYLRIRTGSDVAYFGGLINHILQNNLFHDAYVRNYTNASFIVKEGFTFTDGLFSGYDPAKRTYDIATWAYEPASPPPSGEANANREGPATSSPAFAKRDMTLQHPHSVFQLMKAHYSRYTPDMVSSITGIPAGDFMKVAELVGQMGKPDKVMTIVYAVGLTHHTTGGQLIRSGAVLQLLLGNMGRPGGGMNAERGHANIQGNTDHAISWEILPGYLKIPAPGQKTIADYVTASAPKKSDVHSWNFFGTNYRNFLVSTLKAWFGDAATKNNEFAFNLVPKPAGNASWMTIYDQALKGKMEGVVLSGMTAASIGPDSNQVREALGKLKWLVVMDALPTTSSEFWHAPGVDPGQVKTEVFMVPTTHWIEKDGSFVNSGRWSQWKDQVLPPEGQARHDHWILADIFQRVKKLYQSQGGKFPDPIMAMTLDYKDPTKPELDEIAKEINGKDLSTGKQMASFALLKDDGTTTCGDWIYTGSYTEDGNLMKRRDGIQDPKANDPTGMGFFPKWSWSWPLNRHPKTMSPHDPNAWLPFIMNGEGVGRLFSNSMVDGPFPEHYEPIESPVQNPLHPANSASPVAFLYDKAAGRPDRFGTPREFPYIATSYRLTEHEHYVTQHVPHLVQLQPKPFVEIPYELASDKGIKSGDRVRVSSKRGKVEVLALVTKRLGPMTVAGQRVFQIGIPIHWGYVGLSADSDPSKGRYWLANALTPFVGDANARTPEFKAFLVNLEKI